MKLWAPGEPWNRSAAPLVEVVWAPCVEIIITLNLLLTCHWTETRRPVHTHCRCTQSRPGDIQGHQERPYCCFFPPGSHLALWCSSQHVSWNYFLLYGKKMVRVVSNSKLVMIKSLLIIFIILIWQGSPYNTSKYAH